MFTKYYEIPSETFYEFSSVETFTYVHSAVGQQLSVEDMGAQVKDFIVLVELFTYSFLFYFRNSAKCASDSDCQFCFIWGPKESG